MRLLCLAIALFLFLVFFFKPLHFLERPHWFMFSQIASKGKKYLEKSKYITGKWVWSGCILWNSQIISKNTMLWEKKIFRWVLTYSPFFKNQRYPLNGLLRLGRPPVDLLAQKLWTQSTEEGMRLEFGELPETGMIECELSLPGFQWWAPKSNTAHAAMLGLRLCARSSLLWHGVGGPMCFSLGQTSHEEVSKLRFQRTHR